MVIIVTHKILLKNSFKFIFRSYPKNSNNNKNKIKKYLKPCLLPVDNSF